jgi:uncharacterized protein
MSEPILIYVLDSFALLAYFQAEPGGPIVRDLAEAAKDQKAVLYMSLINVGEMYYIVRRRRNPGRADGVIEDLRSLPITLCAATEDRILAAARVKAEHPLSYADAFAVALAQELDATLVTGDPEFHAVEHLVKITWLPEK